MSSHTEEALANMARDWERDHDRLNAEVERLRGILGRILVAHDKARSLESDALLGALIEAEEALGK